MGGLTGAIRGGLAGLNEAAGNPGVARNLEAENQASRENRLRLRLSPLLTSLGADQQRIAALPQLTGNPKTDAGIEEQRDEIINRMALTTGKIRNIAGDKTPYDHPGRWAESINALRERFHLGGKTPQELKEDYVKRVQANPAEMAARNAWNATNRQMANEYANGALPYSMTPEGQVGAKKAADEQALEARRAAAELAVANARAQAERDVANARQTTKIPKGFKAMEQGGVAFGVMDQDTGKQYLPSQLVPNGDAPPEAKQIWETIQHAQQVKADEQAKHDAERDKRLANTLGNMGTWTIAEDGHGNTILYNSKTGQTREAPAGLHKSGYYAKQIAPLEAAGLNISSYIDGGVYDGPGDLALQHEFFTATQPATGFRMTKVQQDILQNSRNWLNSVQAKAYHFAHGTWFSDEQRRQIAKAAQDAIDAKKKVLMQSSGGPKTDEIRKKAQGGKTINYKIVNGELVPE